MSETALIQTAAASLEGAVKKLHALRPAAEVAQPHAAFIAILEHQEERMRKYVELTAAGETAEAKRLADTPPSPKIARRAGTMRQTFARLGYDIGTEPPTP